MVAGLVGVAASPADAYATCHRVYSDTNWAPSTGHYCTYRNQRISSTEKLRTIKLYKNGRKRALAWITAWSSGKEYPVVCDTKARSPSYEPGPHRPPDAGSRYGCSPNRPPAANTRRAAGAGPAGHPSPG